jgi:hypothetical protein
MRFYILHALVPALHNVRFLGKTQNFQARCGRFSLVSKILKSLRRVQKCLKKGLPREFLKSSFFKPMTYKHVDSMNNLKFAVLTL